MTGTCELTGLEDGCREAGVLWTPKDHLVSCFRDCYLKAKLQGDQFGVTLHPEQAKECDLGYWCKPLWLTCTQPFGR